jgi:hypothetical protein
LSDEFLGDSAFVQEHLEHPVPEDLLELLQVESWGDPEQAFPRKTPVGSQHMQMILLKASSKGKRSIGLERRKVSEFFAFGRQYSSLLNETPSLP